MNNGNARGPLPPPPERLAHDPSRSCQWPVTAGDDTGDWRLATGH